MLDILEVNKVVDRDREHIVIIQLIVHKEMNELQSWNVKSENFVERWRCEDPLRRNVLSNTM